MTPDAQLRRCRLRFSLRTFIAVFTAVAVWLGWNVHLVQRRKEFIADLPVPSLAEIYWEPEPIRNLQLEAMERELISEHLADQIFHNRGTRDGHVPFTTHEPTSTTDLPWIRRQLGDVPYWQIAYFPGPSGDTARRLFPEALIMVADEPWPWPDVRVVKTKTGWREHLGGD